MLNYFNDAQKCYVIIDLVNIRYTKKKYKMV